MKKLILIAIAVIFFLLDWAALHDIIRGNEPNYFSEYSILAISLLFYISIGYYLLKKKNTASAN